MAFGLRLRDRPMQSRQPQADRGGQGISHRTGSVVHLCRTADEQAPRIQFLRDARILPIYEGTNGIQAADLVTRKLGYENGAVLKALPGRPVMRVTKTYGGSR